MRRRVRDASASKKKEVWPMSIAADENRHISLSLSEIERLCPVAKALEADAVAFSKKALRYDLILVPGDSFGAPGYFRIAYCVGTDKVERSLEAFRRFVKAEY